MLSIKDNSAGDMILTPSSNLFSKTLTLDDNVSVGIRIFGYKSLSKNQQIIQIVI